MTTEELRQLLTIAGYACKVKHEEVVMQVCHFCGNERYNLELSADKGVFHCWACKQGGRLGELLRALTGKSYHIAVKQVEKKAPPTTTQTGAAPFTVVPIEQSPVAQEYLRTRDITPAVAREYGLGVCQQAGHRLDGRIVIPAKEYWSRELVGWVGRSFTGRTPKYLTTWDRHAITGWRVRQHFAPVVLVEGHLDGIAVHRAGFNVAVLSGLGGPALEQWAARLDPDIAIVILLDGEASLPGGQADRLYWQITPMRLSSEVRVLRLPEEQDPASLGVEGVGMLVRQALSRQDGTHLMP